MHTEITLFKYYYIIDFWHDNRWTLRIVTTVNGREWFYEWVYYNKPTDISICIRDWETGTDLKGTGTETITSDLNKLRIGPELESIILQFGKMMVNGF